MPNSSIYLDHNATTPCDPRVLEKMIPYFNQWYGNPGNGLHVQGRRAAKSVDYAREQVAALINAEPAEILFTSGATESNNMAILGLARWRGTTPRRRIVISSVEHKAVSMPCQMLSNEGFEIIVLPVNKAGEISLEAAHNAIDQQTLLVSVHLANNEIGTIQPIQTLTKIAHERGALFHCDAAQAVGKITVNVDQLGVDLLSLSAHKFYGPKGIGALYIRQGRGITLEPLMYGGGQEKGNRSGTSNVPGIVGLGEAAELCKNCLEEESVRLLTLRDELEQRLIARIPSLGVNGRDAVRLPNTSSLTFPGVDADALLLNLPNVMMGTGSACTSGAVEPSHVLTAIGLTRAEATSTVRASLGRFTTSNDVIETAIQIIEVYTEMAGVVS